MKVGSLFSGIGGLDLGLERAGMEVIWQVENDPYCRKVLRKHWPEVTLYDDIKEVDWSKVERPDLICGGFPCQPVSLAGKGLAQEDERWLWPEMWECIRMVGPRYALMENVPGLLGRGLGGVLGDLADGGYDAEWDCIPAAAVGAPHLRYRVFIVAHANGKRGRSAKERERRGCDKTKPWNDGSQEYVAHADIKGLEGRDSGGLRQRTRQRAAGESGSQVAHAAGERWGEGRPKPEIRERLSDALKHGGEMADADGGGCEREREPEQPTQQGSRGHQPDRQGVDRRFFDTAPRGEWLTEPNVGRVAHGVPSRVDRLRSLGNAVVPQVAEWIGRRIVNSLSDCG